MQALMGDGMQTRQIPQSVWKRLNDQPLSTLPDSEGPEARKRFEEVSRTLLVKKERVSLAPYTTDWYRARNFGEVSLFNLSAKRVETYIFKEGRNPYAQTSAWSLDAEDDMSISNNSKMVFYRARCTPEDQEDELKLPLDYSGVFFLDWDQDGDEDVAILLKSGQYFFFKQDQCCEECIS